MQLSIITINFRKPLLTTSCIESVYTAYKAFFEKSEFELLIVDNFSEDDSADILEKEIKKKHYKNVHLLLHKENNGFGGGNNFGARHAKGEYLLFLNNDTIVKKGIDTMVIFCKEHPAIGIIGGALKSPNGSVQSSAGKFYTLPRVLLLLLGLQRLNILDKNPTTIAKVDWVKGALLMMSRNFFDTLKGFDEHIFMYVEDMELCYRAYLHKKDVYFYPDVEVLHKDQGSSNRSFAIVSIYAGIIYFYQKHKSTLEQRLVKLLLQSKAHILVSYGGLTKNEYLVTTYEKALSILG